MIIHSGGPNKGYLVPVAVLVPVSEPRVLENEVVVAPCWVGGVVGVAAEVLVEELGRAPEGAGAAQRLRRCRPVSRLVSLL